VVRVHKAAPALARETVVAPDQTTVLTRFPHKPDLPGASRGFFLLANQARPSPMLDPFHEPKGSSPAPIPLSTFAASAQDSATFRHGRRKPTDFGQQGVTGITWEYHEGEACKDIHFRALFDDKNRLMVLGCYNTDNGDGWEREGEDVYFFHRFSENIAYPLAINIIVYSMTH
jgi:hypothetical protein